MEFIHQPTASHRLGDYLKSNLSKNWTHFRAAVAFVKRSGTRHIAKQIAEFAQTGQVEIIAGIDHRGTSVEGLNDLLEAVKPRGQIIIFHNRLPFTFHPKVYIFKSFEAAEVLIGSGNLTEGGLFTNYEATIRLILDLTNSDHISTLQSIESTLDEWADTSSGIAHVLDSNFLDRLISLGLVLPEALSAPEPEMLLASPTGSIDDGDATGEPGREPLDSPFIAHPVPRAPRPVTISAPSGISIVKAPTIPELGQTPSSNLSASGFAHFVMTLQRTDVGVGQTTAGTSRRSPEIFIPLAARNAVPDFWDWPSGFTLDPRRPGKRDRLDVRMRLGTGIVSVNMMTWPAKHDFRLRSEALRSAGNIGDILHLEKNRSRNRLRISCRSYPPRYEPALCTPGTMHSTRT